MKEISLIINFYPMFLMVYFLIFQNTMINSSNLCPNDEENMSINKSINSTSTLKWNGKQFHPQLAVDGNVNFETLDEKSDPICSMCDDLDESCHFIIDIQTRSYVTVVILITGNFKDFEKNIPFNFKLMDDSSRI